MGGSICYTAVLKPAEEGGYVVKMPALPNPVTEGYSLDEARAIVRDVIRACLEGLQGYANG